MHPPLRRQPSRNKISARVQANGPAVVEPSDAGFGSFRSFRSALGRPAGFEEIAPVRVVVLSAVGLEARGCCSSAEVHCSVQVAGRPDTRCETMKVDSRLDLTWNHGIEMLPSMPKESLEFALWGTYWGSSQEVLLGRLVLHSAQFRPDGFDSELPMFECKQTIAPRLRIQVELLKEQQRPSLRTSLTGLSMRDRLLGPAIPHSTSSRRDELRVWEAPSEADLLPQEEQNLRVTVRSATGLRKADYFGLSDPYCVCQVPGKSGSSLQTPVAMKTLDPVWDHSGEVAGYALGDSLLFSVWDWDRLTRDDFLGQVLLPASRFRGGFEGELPLQQAGNGIQASIRVKIEPVVTRAPVSMPSSSSITGLHIRERFLGGPSQMPTVPEMSEQELPQRPAPPKITEHLEVSIISASALRKADFLGKSDPYCIVEVPGSTGLRRQTRTIDNTLYPVWNCTFGFEEYVQGDPLVFTVLDEDWRKPDDLLGRALLASSEFHPDGFSGELELQDAGAQQGKARLKIEVSVKHPDTVTGLHIRKRARAPFEMMTDAKERWKRQAMLSLIEMADGYRQQVLSATRDTIVDSLTADPDMWRCASQAVTQCVEVLWQDVIMEMEAMVRDARMMAAGDAPLKTCQSLGMIGERPHPFSYQGVRSFVLYHFLPYDKSVFGTLADPVYILFFCLSLVPDVRVIFYLLLLVLFVVPGPPDEFQLVQFIMMFKGTQFISSGLAMMAAGGVQYYLCVEESQHTCHTHGPGASQHLLVGLLDICGSCALVWTAFRLLDISEKAAGDRQHDSDDGPMSAAAGSEESDEDDDVVTRRCCFRGRMRQGRGGRLRGFLAYDLVCLCLSSGLLIFLELLHWHRSYEEYADGFELWFERACDHVQTWQFKATLYWARVFYSLLALPFMFFNLPVLQSVLTHTVPTGFNPRGKVVTYMLRPMPEKRKADRPAEEELSQPHNRSNVPASEEETLMQRLADVDDSGKAVLMTRVATIATTSASDETPSRVRR